MNPHRSEDDLLRALRGLPGAVPDVARLERVRVRCHEVLVNRRERTVRWRKRRGTAIHILETVIVGGLSVGYLVAMLIVLIRLR
jgi:hypothetical protein